MKNSTRIILIVLCSLLIILSVAGIIWAFANKFNNKAYAEFADLQDTNTIINFNQLYDSSQTRPSYSNITYSVNNGLITISGTNNNTYSNSANPISEQQINCIAGHKYYFRYYFTDITTIPWTLGLRNPDSTIVFEFTKVSGQYIYDTIFEPNADMTTQVLGGTYKQTTYQCSFYVTMIDLSTCFGVGNEPNLEQAQEYFTASYYSYTTGTPMPFSKDYLQGYQDGATDLMESLTITYNAYTIGASSTAYGNNDIARGDIYFDSAYGAYTFTGVIGVSLYGNVEAGTNFSIDFQLWFPEFSGESLDYKLSYKLTFAYLDESTNTLIDITTINPTNDAWTNTYIGDFVLPATTNKIYLYLEKYEDPDYYIRTFAFNSEMTFKSVDIGLLMTNSYQRGAADIQEKYNINGVEYNAIYQKGFLAGQAAQNATIGTMGYIAAAFTGLGTILQIELLPGIPFSLFILLPLMLSLIFFVVKLSKGGG